MQLLQAFKFAACTTASGGFLPSLWDRVPCDDKGVPNPASVFDMLVIIGNVVRILMAAAGAIAMIVIIVAAIYYIISAGDPGRVKKAKDILTTTITGLILLISAYAIVSLINGQI